MMMMMKYDRS